MWYTGCNMPVRRNSSASSREAAAAKSAAPSVSPKTSSPFPFIIVALVIVVAIVLGLKNMFAPSTTGKSSISQPTQSGSATDDVPQLVTRVARHIVVNDGEEPTVATVQDAETLRAKSPFFYADAQNGDRLLIWSDKAVLYSPTRDIVLAVLPLNVPMNAPDMGTNTTTTAETTAPEVATIEVRNGSGTAGLGRTLVDSLKAAGFTVTPATDAKKKDYATTVIVIKDETKALPVTLQQLQTVTGAQVVALPEGEAALKGDFLVIVGADKRP